MVPTALCRQLVPEGSLEAFLASLAHSAHDKCLASETGELDYGVNAS